MNLRLNDAERKRGKPLGSRQSGRAGPDPIDLISTGGKKKKKKRKRTSGEGNKKMHASTHKEAATLLPDGRRSRIIFYDVTLPKSSSLKQLNPNCRASAVTSFSFHY